MRDRLLYGLWLAPVLCFATSVAGDLMAPGLPHPIRARIEGYVGEKPEGLIPEASWTLSCHGKMYPFSVTHIQVLVGDVSASSIIAEAEAYHVSFYLRATDKVLNRFAATPPSRKIAFVASWRFGSRQLLVGSIEATIRKQPPSQASTERWQIVKHLLRKGSGGHNAEASSRVIGDLQLTVLVANRRASPEHGDGVQATCAATCCGVG